MKEKLKPINNFLNSQLWMYILFILSLIIAMFDIAVYGAFLFVLIITFTLICSSNTSKTTLPFLLLCTFVVTQYDSAKTFIPFWWLGIFVLLAIFFHFIYYRRKLVIGPSIKGIALVSIAVTFGGIGVITLKDYFNIVSIYYIIGLGIGMIILYILCKSYLDFGTTQESFEEFIFILLLVGTLASFMILRVYVINFSDIIATKLPPNMQFQNNCSTIIMICLPSCFYFSFKNYKFIGLGLLMYISMFLSGSRGGIVFGSIELILSLLWIYIGNIEKRKTTRYVLLCSVILVGVLIGLYVHFFNVVLIDENEPRAIMLKEAFQDFKNYFLVGKGLGNRTIVSGAYIPKDGSLYWYHMMIPQILGSMGLLGAVCYTYQFINRAKILLHKVSKESIALFMCYLGLLLMSQVNPGEFCPLPFELLAVIIFIVMENISHVPNILENKKTIEEN